MREYRHRSKALPPPQFTALRELLLNSPLVGKSTLGGPFQSSRGFDVIFKESGRAKVEERFPALAPWFALTLGTPAVRTMTPWWTRTLTHIPNAWYLNVLLVSEGGTVARHVDVTLRKHAEVDDALPRMVSVLYLNVPKSKGGELQLWDGPDPVATLKPQENTSVHFRGDLAHAVRAFSGAPSGELRASLVIEQYHFPDEALARLPEFQLDSRAGFGAFLEHHAGLREQKTFEIEK
ncbi:MAG: 2OG-Fe(II) oxygenase [Archangium sp.]